MEDLIQHLNEVYVEWFVKNLDIFTFVPPPGCVIEIPFDFPDFDRPGLSYEGKPMPQLIPTRDEFVFTRRLGLGLESMPGHDPAAREIASR